MSQRISLTRIIALNWYGFRQIFDVDDNVLISGAFGTGKSALLDLMQYVLLGEHWRANRAAAGNARGRDLVGYCLGDTNQPGREGGRHFLRQSGATLVALEFTRPAERARHESKRETWGVRLEYTSPDAAPKHTYFFIPDRLEYTAIAPNGQMLADDAFRAWIRREYGNDCLFARQKDYLEEMAAPRHLNFDPIAFHRTIPKAIAFEPEENVEKFIREFILEESPLDVRDVRSALRAYDDTRRRLEKQEDEASFLRRIVEQHTIYEKSRRAEAVLVQVEKMLRLSQAEERRDRVATELQQLKASNADDLRELEMAANAARETEKLLNDVLFEAQKDPQQADINRLDREKRELTDAVNALRDAQQCARKRLDDRHYRWMQWLKHGAALPLEGLREALVVDDALLSQLHTGADEQRLAALPKLATRFNELWNEVRDLVRPLEGQIKGTETKLADLAADLDRIKEGQAPGAFPLFNAIRQKLGDRVEQLSRLIEVKPEAERWWPALELFLGRNRHVLVVSDATDYREALEILRRTAPGRDPESLLNPAETQQLRSSVREQSLFTKVTVEHPVARAYVEHLLGDVVCVETVDELERCDAGRAITPEGIFKQAPLRRRLKPATAVELTLGREGLARMRAAKQKEQNEAREALKIARQRLSDVQAWLESGRKGELGDPQLPDRAAELAQLPELEKKRQRTVATLELLMTPEREARQQRLHELQEKQRIENQRLGVLRDRCGSFQIKLRPLEESLANAEKDVRESRLEVETSRVDVSRHFSGIVDAELNATLAGFRADFPKWNDCFAAVQKQAAEAKRAADLARERRQHERTQLASARDEHGSLRHPEYQHEPPVDDESNAAWEARLRTLETVELEKSRQLAADRKQEWERRLEDNVLNELNRRIEDAHGTIRQLDRYLSQPIGRFRYRLSQRKDMAGYGAIWQLLQSGLEITDPLLGAEVERAKRELMAAVNNSEKDERALRLLDYRNYHHYDIEMVPADRPDAPPISLGRSGRNLSGGENQAPFFISMLAAFRRVYDRGDRSSSRSQQLGLVIMDEAFSKLSGDGIEDCLALARTFQLQLIMAFPPERLGVMVPHAQTVVICQKEIERDKDGYVTRISNIPLLATMAEAMEALD